MSSTNNISQFNNMSKIGELQHLLNLDTTANKPKRLLQGGTPTQKALKWNRKQIKEGKTNRYLGHRIFVNLKTGKELKNAFTLNNKLAKAFKDKYSIYQNTAVPRQQTLTYKYFMPNPTLTDENLLENLTADLQGHWRIIIKAEGFKIFDKSYDINEAWWFLNGTDFMVSGSPPAYIWYAYKHKGKQIYYPDGTKVIIIITKEKLLPTIHYTQKYQHGLSNCLITPVLDWFKKKYKSIKSKASRENYYESICELVKFQNTYKNKGVPHEDITNICEELQIGIDITQPFSNKKYLSVKSMKRPRKIFQFINTRLDHIDIDNTGSDLDNLYKTFDPIKLSQEELNNKVLELEQNNTFFIYTKNLYGYSSVKSLTENYTLENEFYDTIQDFQKKSGLKYTGFDALRYPDLQDFVNEGTHFNGTIDFKNTDYLRNIGKRDKPPDNIGHIDMKKAYANFHMCRFYENNKFCGKISDFRKCKEAKYAGLYYIDTLNLDNTSDKFRKLNDLLYWFHEHNIYTKAELDALTYYGGTYTITHGAFGVEPLDFRFEGDMLEKKEVINMPNEKELTIPYYSKFCGIMASLKPNKNFYMKGNKKFLQSIEKSNELKIYSNDYDNESRISFVNRHLYSKKHITAQILAYQRLSMLEQLLKMDTNKILRVCVDGIYYENHNFQIDPVFGDKSSEMTFKNDPCEQYLSGIIWDTDEFNSVKKMTDNLGMEKEVVLHELLIGAGGTGKTYETLFIDKGLIHPIYVAPSWKLATDMAKEYKKKTGFYLKHTVINRMLKEPYAIQEEYLQKGNTKIFDEASMITEGCKEQLLKTAGKSIFIGDLECQVKPVVNPTMKKALLKLYKGDLKTLKKYTKMMDTTGFDLVRPFLTNYRFTCPLQKQLTDYLRENIENKVDFTTLENVNYISKEEVADLYNYKEDMILCATHELITEYTKMFEHLPKYRVKSNYTQYKNGEIIFEKIKGVDSDLRHGFTIHSVQGLTFENKLFIDIRHIHENRNFYTAISRARQLEQIYIII